MMSTGRKSVPGSGGDMSSDTPTQDKNTTSVLSRKLSKVLETRLENDKETLDALKELSTFFKDNTLHTRRSLRSQIEKRSLAINEDFLSTFCSIKEALDGIYNDVSSMNKIVQNMSVQLQSTKAQTHHLIEQTTKLQGESEKLCLQQDVAAAFIRSFQLTPAELAILRGSRDANISIEFFGVLDRVQEIHRNCRVLMQSGHQTAALEIMEQMALYQETALERLYRWTQGHCRNIESPEIAALLTPAMGRLQDRPVLFKYVLDEYCTSRRSVLVRVFIDALTKGGPGGTPKAIEMHAHDPPRYIGDMLAWLHQAVPGEKENLHILLKGCDKTDVCEQLQGALASITEGICHPLRVRVEHILASEHGATVLHSVSNLLNFYQQVISQVVPGSILATTLTELQQAAHAGFLSALQTQVKQLSEYIDGPSPDLSPPQAVAQLLALLKDMLAGDSMVEHRQQHLKEVVTCIVEPLLQVVNESASRLPTVDMSVYLLNCLYQTQSTLSLYEFMDERLERLQAQTEAQMDTLTSEQASSMVAHLGLGAIYTILQESGRGPLSSVPGMDPASLANFLGKLDNFLTMPDLLLLPQTRLLLSGSYRRTIQKRACEVICAIYRQLYQAVHNPDNQYPNADTLMSRTPEQLQSSFL